MRESKTEFGHFCVGEKETLFEKALFLVREQKQASLPHAFSWALTGGSTPAAFYRYCIEKEELGSSLIAETVWTTSDERCVSHQSEESNFGNADRQLLTPAGVRTEDKLPWPTELSPVEAAEKYTRDWSVRMGEDCSYDMCFLGMGDDCHTASIFPGSPLVSDPIDGLFAAVEVLGKGWRLTVTPMGLEKAKRIVVMALGSGKTKALKEVFEGGYDPRNKPIQLLKNCAARVWWLVDEAAAKDLRL